MRVSQTLRLVTQISCSVLYALKMVSITLRVIVRNNTWRVKDLFCKTLGKSLEGFKLRNMDLGETSCSLKLRRNVMITHNEFLPFILVKKEIKVHQDSGPLSRRHSHP